MFAVRGPGDDYGGAFFVPFRGENAVVGRELAYFSFVDDLVVDCAFVV